MHILLIEDNEGDQFLFQEIAQRAAPNCKISIAGDGQEAIDLLTAENFIPDIIFLDINMPRMNGHDFLAAYGKNIEAKGIPVYVLSSSTYEKGSVLFSPYQCIVDICMKSVSYDQVSEALNHCLTTKQIAQ